MTLNEAENLPNFEASTWLIQQAKNTIKNEEWLMT